MPFRSLSLAALMLASPVALLSACGGPAATSGSGADGSGADPGRAAFESVTLPSDNTAGADPLTLAQELYGAREPVEGNYTEATETLSSSDQQQVLLFTQLGLLDDSVRGMRHRLEFEPEGGLWQLTWAGRQVTCWPGRGHQDWSTQPCQ
jgi:hypothetical protein